MMGEEADRGRRCGGRMRWRGCMGRRIMWGWLIRAMVLEKAWRGSRRLVSVGRYDVRFRMMEQAQQFVVKCRIVIRNSSCRL